MANLPAITTPRGNTPLDLRTLADQTRERLNKADAATDEAKRLARAAGSQSLNALTSQVAQLSQVVNQLAIQVRDIDTGTGSTTIINNTAAWFDPDEPEAAFF